MNALSVERSADEALLRAEAVTKEFVIGGRGKRKTLRAVAGVSLSVRHDETLAIVGESGSGKSTLARALLRLIEPTSGAVYFRGQDLLRLGGREMREARRYVQIVFQDPYASLHPHKTVEQLISDPWRFHPGVTERGERHTRTVELLQEVGLSGSHAYEYPTRLSGGERQRVAIARALALRPELLVLDEPVSSLDVSIQAQVITLLMKLKQELKLGYIFISHDLGLVRLVADRVAVMYMGRFVEEGTVGEIFESPSHPYTQALLAASPSLVEGGRANIGAGPTVAPEPLAVSSVGKSSAGGQGCPFRPRCWKAAEVCAAEEPALEVRPGTGHPTACHFSSAGQVAGAPRASNHLPGTTEASGSCSN